MKKSVWKNFKPNSEIGYFIECDIDYDDPSLHTKLSHHHYPLLPERTLVTWKDLSPAAKKLLVAKVGLKAAKRYKSYKLISSFRNKKKMVIHYMTYKQALEKGLKVRRIRKAIGFKQSAWAKPFLEKMTRMRGLSKTSLEEKQFKFIGIIIYFVQSRLLDILLVYTCQCSFVSTTKCRCGLQSYQTKKTAHLVQKIPEKAKKSPILTENVHIW